MRGRRRLEIIAGHMTAAGVLDHCTDPNVSVNKPGASMYEFKFPDNFQLVSMTANIDPNAAGVCGIGIPNPNNNLSNTARVNVQVPIGTNADNAFQWTAVGYQR